jgi:hypothetical protein
MVSGVTRASTAWTSAKVAGTRVIHCIPLCAQCPKFSAV